MKNTMEEDNIKKIIKRRLKGKKNKKKRKKERIHELGNGRRRRTCCNVSSVTLELMSFGGKFD